MTELPPPQNVTVPMEVRSFCIATEVNLIQVTETYPWMKHFPLYHKLARALSTFDLSIINQDEFSLMNLLPIVWATATSSPTRGVDFWYGIPFSHEFLQSVYEERIVPSINDPSSPNQQLGPLPLGKHWTEMMHDPRAQYEMISMWIINSMMNHNPDFYIQMITSTNVPGALKQITDHYIYLSTYQNVWEETTFEAQALNFSDLKKSRRQTCYNADDNKTEKKVIHYVYRRSVPSPKRVIMSKPKKNISDDIVPPTPVLKTKKDWREFREAMKFATEHKFHPQALPAFLQANPDVNVTHDISENVLNVIDNLQSTVEKLTNALESLTASEAMSSKAEDIGLNSVRSTLKHLPFILAIGATGYMFRNTGSKYWGAATMVCVVGYVSTAEGPIRSFLLKIIKDLGIILEKGGMTAQAPKKKHPPWKHPVTDALPSVDSIIASLMLGIVYYVHIGKVPTKNQLAKAVMALPMLPRMVEGFSYAFTHVMAFIENIVNYIRVNILGLEGLKLYAGTLPELDQWIDKVDYVVRESQEGKLAVTNANAHRIFNLINEGNRLSVLHLGMMDSARVKNAMNTYMATLRRLSMPFENANIKIHGPRMEPIVIFLTGASGVGKSKATLPILIEVLGAVLPFEQLEAFNRNYMDFMYARQAETKYWDGYKGQFAIVFDDFGQIRDMQGVADNEYLDIIRGGNLFPSVCHMAALEAKGVTVFNSRIMLLSSNMETFNNLESINCPEAVMRRFNICARVVPKVEYCKPESLKLGSPEARRLDHNHPDLSTGAFNSEIYEFHTFKFRKNGSHITGDVLSYKKFIERVIQLYRMVEGSADAYNHYLTRSLNTVVKDRQLEELTRPKTYTPDPDFETMQEQEAANALDFELDNFTDQAGQPESSRDASSRPSSRSTSPIFDRLPGRSRTASSCPASPQLPNLARSEPLFKEAYEDFHAKNAKEVLSEDSRTWDEIKADLDRGAYGPKSRMNLDTFQKLLCNTLQSAGVSFETWRKALHFWTGDDPESCVLLCYWLESKFPNAFWSVVEDTGELLNLISYADKKYGLTDYAVAIESGLGAGEVERMNNARLEITAANKTMQKSVSTTLSKYSSIVKFGSVIGVLSFAGTMGVAFKKLIVDPFMKRESEDNPLDDLMVTLDAGSNTIKAEAYETRKKNATGRKRGKVMNRANAKEMRHEAASQRSDSPTSTEGGDEDVEISVATPDPNIKDMTAEGGVDVNSDELAAKIVQKNLYKMYIPGREPVAGYVLVIRDRISIIPRHYIGLIQALIDAEKITEETNLVLKSDFIQRDILLPAQIILDAKWTSTVDDKDICCFELPKWVHHHADITKCFLPEGILQKSLNLQVRMIGTINGVLSYKYAQARFGDRNIRIKSSMDPSDFWVMRHYLVYRMYTIPGDCGSVIMLVDKSVGPYKLIGVHVAGSDDGLGLASVLSQEDVLELASLFKSTNGLPNMPLTAQCLNVPLPFKGDFIPLAQLEKGAYEVGATSLIKSRVYGAWGPAKTKPARLRPFTNKQGETIVPKYKAIAKYGIPGPVLDPELVTLVRDYIFSYFLKAHTESCTANFKVHDFETAVKGIPGDKFANSIPRQTSAGYPYAINPQPGYSGKTWFFGKDDEFDLTREQCLELKKEVEEIIARAARGERSLNVFIDIQKDEKRPIAKVEEGKTRLVSMSALAYLIVCRMFFMDFTRFFMYQNLNIGSGVGLNPYSRDWDILARKLQAIGNKNVAGDFSGFDGSELAQVLIEIVEIVNKMYNDGPINALIRRVLWMDLYNSIHLCGDILYLWLNCMPSGHPLTTIVNTIYGLFMFLMVWAKLAPKHGLLLEDFHDKVYFCGYGDDGVLSVSEAVLDWYNQEVLTHELGLLGLKYTSEAKDDIIHHSRPLDEVSFLKRSFRWESQLARFVAPLDIETITETPYWLTHGQTDDAVEKMNINFSLEELSLHSMEVFNEWAPKILNAARDHMGYVPPVTHRNKLLRRVCEREDFY